MTFKIIVLNRQKHENVVCYNELIQFLYLKVVGSEIQPTTNSDS